MTKKKINNNNNPNINASLEKKNPISSVVGLFVWARRENSNGHYKEINTVWPVSWEMGKTEERKGREVLL